MCQISKCFIDQRETLPERRMKGGVDERMGRWMRIIVMDEGSEEGIEVRCGEGSECTATEGHHHQGAEAYTHYEG